MPPVNVTAFMWPSFPGGTEVTTGGLGQEVPTNPGLPGITVGDVPEVPGITVGGIPGSPGITVDGVPGVPGITVSAVPGVPGVGLHWVEDLEAEICNGLERLTASATALDSSKSGACSSISTGAPLSNNTSLLALTSTYKVATAAATSTDALAEVPVPDGDALALAAAWLPAFAAFSRTSGNCTV
jgi:hypothetical protein